MNRIESQSQLGSTGHPFMSYRSTLPPSDSTSLSCPARLRLLTHQATPHYQFTSHAGQEEALRCTHSYALFFSSEKGGVLLIYS